MKEWFVDAHVLDADQPTSRDQVEHAVDQQEGVAVGQKAHDSRNVDRAVLLQGKRLDPAGPAPCGPLEQPAHECGVGLVARSVRHHEPVKVDAEESQVADHVEDLVPGALVGVAQLVADDAVAAEEQEVGRGGPDADPGGAEGRGLRLQEEGPARRQARSRNDSVESPTQKLWARIGASRP